MSQSRSSLGQLGPVTSKTKNQTISQQNTDYEEFASLQLDRPSEGELRTNEEMKRHLFDDHFEGRPIERAMHILAVGEEVQRLSVIRDLIALLQADEQGCMQRVVSKINQALSTATIEFHIEAAKSFSLVLEKKAVSSSTFAQGFLPSIIYHIDNKDQIVSNAWLETLLTVSELLPIDIVKNHILPISINKGQISQNVWQRMAACKLLGKMCTRFDNHTVKKDILPVVLSLCQDVNETVRACICSQLHLVAKGIPGDMVKSALIPILVELGRDETVLVRVEATETIVNIIPLLNQDILKVTIYPLIKKICEQAVLATDDTVVMVARQFGSLCLGLENCLTLTEKVWMVTYYHNLSHMGVPSHSNKKDTYISSHNMDRVNARFIECRQSCAYNFPAMAKFCSPNAELLDKLYPSFCDFTTDPYFMVRKTIGAGIHEVARILGPNNKVVKNQVMTLLWDNMEEVLMGIVPQLGRTIDYLISSGVIGHEDGVSFELGRGLLQCDKTIRDKTHNWRLYSDFITQLESIVKCLSSDYIYSHFVSLMFEKMHRARPLPVRLAAAKTLLIFLRYNLKNNQRQEIRSRLQSEFCLSSSCYKRMLYLRLCNLARDIFSRAYFKEHFFYPLLSRSDDKVANNRLLLIRQFPYLKAMIVMPSEKKYLQTLETCVRTMAISEKDKDVTVELRALIHRMDKTETLLDNNPNPTPDDLEDRKKFEEELRIANAVQKSGPGFPAPAPDNRKAQKDVKPSRTSGSRLGQTAHGSATSNTSTLSPRPERVSSIGVDSLNRAPSGSSTISPRPERVGSYVSSSSHSSHSVSGQYVSYPHRGNVGFTNTTNQLYPIRSLSTHITNIDPSCTCFPTTNFRSENLRNLNLLALIDNNLVNSKQKLSESLKQKLNEDPRFKMAKSAKRNMEISWLNLETDMKNELYALIKNREIHGDRNLKEKSKFLSDFRSYNDANLSKFINDDREYKETIYSVTGIGISNSYERHNSNFFEERINFFERKIKLEDQKTNNPDDCVCFDLTTNRNKGFEDMKKFSYFSKNFEEDFYRDAGVKANEIMGKKFAGMSNIDKQPTQIASPKISTTVMNKRRTWFGNENGGSVKLESITGYQSKISQKKKSETLPARESVSLKKLGIGPRSKSFILPSTLIYADKATNCQSTKLIFDKENLKIKTEVNQNSRSETEVSRFGFRNKATPKADSKLEKPFSKIPIGRVGNGSSPCTSRSTSPNLIKDKTEAVKPQTNGTKKIPVVVSRKSMLIQSNSIKNEIRNNRRSLDSTKISLANMDKPGLKRRSEKFVGKSKTEGLGVANPSGRGSEDKGEMDVTTNGNSSKLPVRRQKPDK